ncbi:two-component regulator propeller domain-containing protein [Roseimarinus sediminis]|jgi:signal transduction histidine kinase/ligand-binding sensor domain-containing protein/DNA-binding response OmpR family regulator|uniref:two-component regulator propeller domain-containing protein n=1 Tax=Roseimarinus sediminis TaxID=1610899 RepID=UPI003D247CD4
MKNKFKYSFMLALSAYLLLGQLILFAQQNGNTPLFDNLKVKDGLPNNEIYNITQDSLGFMWFASNNGFVRYDGYEMQIYRKSSKGKVALSNNQITALENSSKAGLWVATYEGLIYFDTPTGNSHPIDLGGHREIRCLLNQGDSILWAGSSEGLFKINLQTGAFYLYNKQNSNLGSNIIRALYLDSQKTLWIGTFDGLNQLNSEGQILHYDLKGTYKPELKNNLILDIQPFGANNKTLLWIGTETGLVLFDKQKGSIKALYNLSNTAIQNEVVKCIYTPTPGMVYIGTDFGLYQIDTESRKVQASFHDPFNTYSIANNVVWDIFEDKAGILWLATSNGISKINSKPSLFHFAPIVINEGERTIGTQINDLYVDQEGTVWLATKKGIIALSPDGQRTSFTANTTNNKLVMNNINTIHGDRLGRIWIGSAGGINVWDPKKQRMHTITASFDLHSGLRSNYISAFISPPDGSFWLSTWGGGMYKVSGDFNEIEELSFDYITNFNTNVVTTNKKIWLRQENKIYSIDLLTFKIESLTRLNQQLADETVTSLHASATGTLWIGTHNLLLSYTINTGTIASFPVFTGADSYLLNLVEDHRGNIWGTTLTSIFKLETPTGNVETFPKNNGIPLDNFLHESKAVSPDGTIYFGGNDGYISFDPAVIEKNTYEPRVIISSLVVNNKKIASLKQLNRLNNTDNMVTYNKNIVLKYDQHSFELGFASLHYGASERNLYAYRLEGYDDEWHYTSGRKNMATYSNLSAGNYLFKVKATNNDGVWFDNNMATLQIKVKPPVWAGPAAIIIYLLLLQAAIVSLIITYRNKVRWKEKIRLITIEKEKNEELARVKQQFFTNISHEFRTPLSLIMGPVDSLLQSISSENKNYRMVELISKNARRLLSLVNQLLDLRKIENNTLELHEEKCDIIDLFQRQFQLFADRAENRQIHYSFSSDCKLLECTIDINKTESIVQNLLSNAFRFTSEGGSISLKVVLHEPGLLRIEVADTGCGIAPGMEEKIFTRFYHNEQALSNSTGYGIGLNISREYCELMGGKISYESELAKGSTFFVDLPLKILNYREELTTMVSEKKALQTKEKYDRWPQLHDAPVLLLVDDHFDTLNYLSIELANSYTVLTASSADEALQLIDKQQVSLIVSDIMMPDMDGITFCEQLKNHPKHGSIPLILLTARTFDNQQIEGFRAGADAYLSKPFNIGLLKAQIENLLLKSRKTDQLIKQQLIIENQQVEVLSSDEKLLQEVITYVNKHLSDPEIKLETMSRSIGISHSSLYRKIKSQTGMSVNELVRSIRLRKAARLIKTGKLTIAEIMDETGFTSHSYFAKCFKKQYQMNPRDYANTKE